MSLRVSRTHIITTARSWLGTPYQHQASLKGCGCDCLGFVRGVFRELYGYEPLAVPPYSPDWAEKSGCETLLKAAETCLTPLDRQAVQTGDVLLFRMHMQAPVKHMALLSAPDTIIHAYWGQVVVESYLQPFWYRRWSHAFAFPHVQD